MCACVCVEASKESSADTKSNAGDFSTVCTCKSVCVSNEMLCECVGHQRAAVKTPERRGSAHPHSGAATHKIMCTEKEKQ